MSIGAENAYRTGDFHDQLVGEQFRIALVGKFYVFGFLLASTVPYVFLDIYYPEGTEYYGLFGMIVWALGYILFVGVMKNGGYLGAGKQTGVGTYFVLGMAVGLPVLLGLVLLILPGLYLLMRWLPSYSRALVTSDGVGKAMRWSWEATEPFQRQLGIALIGPLACYGASIAMILSYDAFYEHFDWAGYIAISILSNAVQSIGVAWFTILGVAAYGSISRPIEDVEVTFG